jgi:hypothetical protein
MSSLTKTTDSLSLRAVESEGVAVVCATDCGTFPYSALRVDTFGMVWHDGAEFDGDIICHGPFTLHVSKVATDVGSDS